MTKENTFEHWAIVQIFGHQTFAGKVSEQTIGGCSFVRVDVPDVDKLKGFTQLFGNGAIYSITIVDEETARIKANELKKQPITEWEVSGMIKSAIDQHILQLENHQS